MKGIIKLIGGSIGLVISGIIATKGFIDVAFEKHEIGDLIIEDVEDAAEEVL